MYDIHAPRVPPQEEMEERLDAFLKAIPHQKDLFVNPDCGLKTRGWPEVEASLRNLVGAAKAARAKYPQA